MKSWNLLINTAIGTVSGTGLKYRSLYADFNVINFSAGNSGAQIRGWFKREIQSVADLNGLKMQVPRLREQV